MYSSSKSIGPSVIFRSRMKERFILSQFRRKEERGELLAFNIMASQGYQRHKDYSVRY